MSLRLRVALSAAVAVLISIVAASVALYFGVRHHLYDQIDASLAKIRTLPGGTGLQMLEHALESGGPGAAAAPRGAQAYLQFVSAHGRVIAQLTPATLPTGQFVRAIARGPHPAAFFNATVTGTPVRVYAFHLSRSTAFEVGHSLTDVTTALHDLLTVAAIVTAGGVGLAVIVGALVAIAALRPVRRLSAAVQAVATTGELSHHVEVSGRDEFSQVAAGFNAMLSALDESLSRQRRLVADASHVLRTPLATVRANVEILRRAAKLQPGEREQVIRETAAQTAELSRLVNNLMELARGDEEIGAYGMLRLDELAADVVAEARRNHPAIRFELTRTPSNVWGSPDRLHKALGNLVDNAAKWTDPGTPVEISVAGRSIVVRDHGPGVDPADIPQIFDRFYRSLSAANVPGSGLGLAIAKQAIEAHGGQLEVRDAEGGGAEFSIQLPESGPAAQQSS